MAGVVYTVRACSREDLEVLLRSRPTSREHRHHRERFGLQQAGTAVYLIAWEDGHVRGRCTLLRRSKYEQVRELFETMPEINALAADPPGLGAGSALLAAAEDEARRSGAVRIGLAVEITNRRARKLYERNGYSVWDGGAVTDTWTELDDEGPVEHADPCHYLIKNLTK